MLREGIPMPSSSRPRRDRKRRSRLVEEHRRRHGDPVAGGSTRRPLMTAYRQQALACAATLARGAARPRDLNPALPDAPKILLRNVYGPTCQRRRENASAGRRKTPSRRRQEGPRYRGPSCLRNSIRRCGLVWASVLPYVLAEQDGLLTSRPAPCRAPRVTSASAPLR